MTTNIVNVPIPRISASPYQPMSRIQQLDDRCEEFAASIRQHGMKAIPHGRIIHNGKVIDCLSRVMYHKYLTDNPDAFVQLQFGHHRWAGYCELHRLGEVTEMPLILAPYTDEEMAIGLHVENKDRYKQTAIEDLEYYQMLETEFDWKPAEIANRVGKSASTVKNTIRFKHLPPAVTRLIQAGAITNRKGAELIRIYQLPKPAYEKALKFKRDTWRPSPAFIIEKAQNGTSSDEIRSMVSHLIDNATQSLKAAPFDVDDEFDIPNIVAPRCVDCPLRILQTSRCGDVRCYGKKVKTVKDGLVKAEAKRLDVVAITSGAKTVFTNYGGKATDKHLKTIMARKKTCPHLGVCSYDKWHGVKTGIETQDITWACDQKKCACVSAILDKETAAEVEKLTYQERRRAFEHCILEPAKLAIEKHLLANATDAEVFFYLGFPLPDGGLSEIVDSIAGSILSSTASLNNLYRRDQDIAHALKYRDLMSERLAVVNVVVDWPELPQRWLDEESK